MFPGLAKNFQAIINQRPPKKGARNWIPKAFSYYLGNLSEGWPEAARRFHSLRKTLSQQMQTAGGAHEMHAQIVGHELD